MYIISQDALREAHQDAFQKSLASFNATAVGAGSARINYEKQLQNFCRKAFEVSFNCLYLCFFYSN